MFSTVKTGTIILRFFRAEYLGSSDDALTLRGGSGNDNLNVRSSGGTFSFNIDGGVGSDQISFINSYGSNSFIVDAGADDDQIFVSRLAGSALLTLGTGSNSVRLGQDHADDSGSSITITDFQTGLAGDRIDILAFLGKALTTWDQSSNPFATGHLRLVQSGPDTLLQIDPDGGGGYGFSTLIKFQNTRAESFTAENLDGYPSESRRDGWR